MNAVTSRLREDPKDEVKKRAMPTEVPVGLKLRGEVPQDMGNKD